MRLWMLGIMFAFVLAGAWSHAQSRDRDASSATPDFQPPRESRTKAARTKTVRTKTEDVERGLLAAGEDPQNRLLIPFLQHLALDQKQFWAGPFHLDRGDARWLAPFAAFTGAVLAGDRWISRQVPESAVGRSASLSKYATYSLAGAAGTAYLWGKAQRDDHLGETGLLAGEAALDSASVAYLFKTMTQRERPLEGDGEGRFFRGGASTPSEHAALAWSVAGVVAHEYPGALTQIAAYGLASTVTLARVTGKQHFPSDALLGSVLGWYFARQAYRARHDPELGGAAWGSFSKRGEPGDEEVEQNDGANDAPRDPARMGSPFVPLDSWIYPALERLAAFGYVSTAFAGMKPWTRLACAEFVDEAGDELAGGEGGGADLALVSLEGRLQEEFARESRLRDGQRNLSARIESAYLRGVSISGPALTDSYHFGQTVAYDFGRPFERGTNGQAGGAVSMTDGAFAFYVRAEYQHAPAAPALSEEARQAIAAADDNPVSPGLGANAINRPRLLDTYLTLDLGALHLENWQLTAGRESRSWAPGLGGSFLLSDNAEPFDMIELANPEGVRLPFFLKFLGPARIDQFVGRLGGRTDHANPWVYGQKISFHPLRSLEIGYGRMTTLGGRGGDPFTSRNFLLSLFGQLSPALRSVPGDSDNEMDWTFYVPKVRHALVFYGEVYAEDDFIAWVRPSAYPFRPGIYLTRIPGLPKLDLHVEAASTEAPGWHGVNGGNNGQFIYFDSTYHEADTNRGFLLGNTVGRMGQAIEGWLTYWASPGNTFQFSCKSSSVDAAFLPGGGAWQDYGVRHEIHLGSGFYMKSQVQYEHIARYPLLFPGPRNNLTAWIEIGLLPRISFPRKWR